MIENELQYKITKERLADFEAALKRPRPGEITEALYTAHTSAVRSQIADLRAEIKEYESKNRQANETRD